MSTLNNSLSLLKSVNDNFIYLTFIVVVQCKPPRRDQPLYKDQSPRSRCGLSSEVSLYTSPEVQNILIKLMAGQVF